MRSDAVWRTEGALDKAPICNQSAHLLGLWGVPESKQEGDAGGQGEAASPESGDKSCLHSKFVSFVHGGVFTSILIVKIMH